MACFVRDVISLFKLYSNLDIGSVVFTMVRISLDLNLRDNSWLKVFLELLIRKNLKIMTEDSQGRIQGGATGHLPPLALPRGGNCPPWGVWKGKIYGDKHWKESDN